MCEKILVIDDGSSDKTTEIANSIESETIKVFTLDKNRGKGYALNYGLKIAMKNAVKELYERADIITTTNDDSIQTRAYFTGIRPFLSK